MSEACSKCGIEIPKKDYDYSKKNYGESLCRDCQKDSNPRSKNKKEDSKKKELLLLEWLQMFFLLLCLAQKEMADFSKDVNHTKI